MKRSRQEPWLHDIEARQRNIVFPDTASNEARFWRNIISGKQRLGAIRIVGIALICGALAAGLYGAIVGQWHASADITSNWRRVIISFGDWVALLLIAGIVLLLGKVISNRSSKRAKHQKS